MVLWSDEIVRGRNAVIRRLVETGKMPSLPQLADDLSLSAEAASSVLHRMHDEHAVLLDGQGQIRMLSPFSGVPTPFQVTVGDRSYWANCAWDSVGIPAALHADAVICACFADSSEETTITVRGGKVSHGAYLVHFPHPVRRWYDDLVYT